jgi:hypothetical protein
VRLALDLDAGRAQSGHGRVDVADGVVVERAGSHPIEEETGAFSVLVFGVPCSLGRLAATEDVAAPTMTRIVDGLERLGLATAGFATDVGDDLLGVDDRCGAERPFERDGG